MVVVVWFSGCKKKKKKFIHCVQLLFGDRILMNLVSLGLCLLVHCTTSYSFLFWVVCNSLHSDMKEGIYSDNVRLKF